MKQIKLLGLAGTYVQMLTKTILTLEVSSPFGLDYVLAWMEDIYISGTSSVKNGYRL